MFHCRRCTLAERTLPEIPEAAATGDVAAFYQRIRAESGSPLVNYVWRHLATIPGASEWCWTIAWAHHDEVQCARIVNVRDDYLATLAPLQTEPVAELTAASHRILDEYNRNNVTNLARLGVLHAALNRPPLAWSRHVPQHQQPRDFATSGSRLPLPLLPDQVHLGDTDRTAVLRLRTSGPASESGVDPSLWRHLSVQPGLLPTIEPAVSAVLASEGFARAHKRIREEACSITVTDAPALPDNIDRARLLASINAFSERIGELTLAGAILAQMTRPVINTQ